MIYNKKEKRVQRVRQKIKKMAAQSGLPRLAVFRSHKYIYGQIIGNKKGEILTAVSEKTLKIKGTKTERAWGAGQILAQQALALKIKKVVFDRGPYQYHGRVKAFAEGAKEGGLKF